MTTGGRNGRCLSSFSPFSCSPSSSSSSRQPVLGIRREESSVWERRAPLNPQQVNMLTREGVKVPVHKS